MPELARLEVRAPAVRVDERPVGVARHRVDREVAALQVVLERDVGREMQLEAAIARPGLALGARERVLFAGSRGAGTRESRGRPGGSRGPASAAASRRPRPSRARRPAGRAARREPRRRPDRLSSHHVTRFPVAPDPAARGRGGRHRARRLLLRAHRRGPARDELAARADCRGDRESGDRRVAASPPRVRRAGARLRDDRPRPARQRQLPHVRGSRPPLCDLEPVRRAGIVGRAEALVLSGRRLRELSRLLRRGARGARRRRSCARAASTPGSARPSPIRRSATCATRC